jgi:glucan phosphoethanolaminetransferase (alkaline phosphatase superfamily)
MKEFVVWLGQYYQLNLISFGILLGMFVWTLIVRENKWVRKAIFYLILGLLNLLFGLSGYLNAVQ